MASTIGRAGPLSTEPQVTVASEYSSNPFLTPSGARAVSDVALLVNAPVSYDLDATHFSLLPSIRYASGGSYSSLASNYFHLRGTAQYASEVDTVSLTSGIGRDSSLYLSGLKSGGTGVRTDGSNATVDWQHSFSERLATTTDLGWSAVRYGSSAGQQGLVDYRYYSEGTSASYATDERTKIQAAVGAGQYVALNGITRSLNYNLQTGFSRALNELWSFSAGTGYARSYNSIKVYYGPFFLGGTEYGPYYLRTVHSLQQGPVYNASLSRQGETFTLTAIASRAYRPSGFEFLSRSDTAELDLSYNRSERWTYTGKLNFQSSSQPFQGGGGGTYSVHYLTGLLATDFHWTPTWTISLHATWVKVRYTLPTSVADSTGASLQISRQFLRIDL